MTHTPALSTSQTSLQLGEPRMRLPLEARAEKAVRELAARQQLTPQQVIDAAFKECGLTPPVVQNYRSSIRLDLFEQALSEFEKKRGRNDPNTLISDLLGLPTEGPDLEPAQQELAFA